MNQPPLEVNRKDERVLGESYAAHRVRVRAARLRVVTDKKLGQATPEWILKLASEDLTPQKPAWL
jgi:hypothetical protein